MARRTRIRDLRNVDIRLLRIFLTVCECGGLSASQIELNIGRSAISKCIADLEIRMGFRLCNRGPSGFSITEEGERVVDAARRLFATLSDFRDEIDDIHDRLKGTLRLGLFDQSTTNPEARVHEAIKLFDTLAPDVDLEISIEPPTVIEARVTEGSMDIGIVPVHRKSSSLEYLSLYREVMTLYCGREHPLFGLESTKDMDMSKVAKHKYAGFGFSSPNMSAGQRLGLKCAARVQDEEALSLLIHSGRYLGFLADHVADEFLRRNEVAPVAQEHTQYSSKFAAITRKNPPPSRKTQLMLDQLSATHPASV